MSEVTNEHIDRLARASEAQTEASRELALATVEHQERARLAQRRFRVQVLLILVGFALLYWRQDNSNDKLHGLVNRVADSQAQGAAVREVLIDCVQPSGTCYKKGQQSTAKIVGTVTQVSVLAAACAPDYVHLPVTSRIVAIERCIRKGLK